MKSADRTRQYADANRQKHSILGHHKTMEIEAAAKKHRDEDH